MVGLGRDEQATAIVRSVVALAKSLNLSITGEGVENSTQCDHLQMLGCDRGQGHLFAKPAPAAELNSLLAADMAVASERHAA